MLIPLELHHHGVEVPCDTPDIGHPWCPQDDVDVVVDVEEDGGVEALLLDVDEACEAKVDDVVRGTCVDQDVDASARHHSCKVHGGQPRTTDYVVPIIMRRLLSTSLVS